MREHVLRELHLLRLLDGDGGQLRGLGVQVPDQHLPDAPRLQHLHHHGPLHLHRQRRQGHLRKPHRHRRRGQHGLAVPHRWVGPCSIECHTSTRISHSLLWTDPQPFRYFHTYIAIADTFTVSSPGTTNPPVICGTNTGQHSKDSYSIGYIPWLLMQKENH